MYLSPRTIDYGKKFAGGASHCKYRGIATAPPVITNFATKGKLLIKYCVTSQCARIRMESDFLGIFISGPHVLFFETCAVTGAHTFCRPVIGRDRFAGISRFLWLWKVQAGVAMDWEPGLEIGCCAHGNPSAYHRGT